MWAVFWYWQEDFLCVILFPIFFYLSAIRNRLSIDFLNWMFTEDIIAISYALCVYRQMSLIFRNKNRKLFESYAIRAVFASERMLLIIGIWFVTIWLKWDCIMLTFWLFFCAICFRIFLFSWLTSRILAKMKI